MAYLSVSMTLMAYYGQPPREEGTVSKTLLLLVAISNFNQIHVFITAPKDLETLTIELGAYKLVLSSEERSRLLTKYPKPDNSKITDSSKKVLFEAENFYFEKNAPSKPFAIGIFEIYEEPFDSPDVSHLSDLDRIKKVKI
jgi:hypothetical protein